MSFSIPASNLQALWDKYKDFEAFTRKKDGDLIHFVEQWKEKMAKAQSVGCQYSDLLLGLKLIEKANLGHTTIESIISKLASSSYDSFLTKVVAEIKESNSMYGTFIDFPEGMTHHDDESKLKEEAFDKESKQFPCHICSECGCVMAVVPGHLRGDVFQCSGCDNVVTLNSGLKKPSELITCTLCSLQFVDKKSFSLHNIDFHTDVKERLATGSTSTGGFLKCSICGKNFMLMKTLDRHMKHHKAQKECNNEDLIDKIEDDKNDNFDDHIKEEIEFEAKHESPVVKKDTAKLSEVPKKRRPRKAKDSSSNIRDVLGSLVVREVNPQNSVTCEICCRNVNLASMKRHMARHTALKKKELYGDALKREARVAKGNRKVPCEVCGKSVTEKRMNEHLTSHNPKDIECNVCQKRFGSKRRLKIHMETHRTTLDYICSYCGKKFKTKPCMKEHMNLHTRQKILPCKFCDKTFLCHSSLLFHTRVHHTGERPYKCDYCDKRFFISYKKTEHMRSHTGEKPFNCDICGKAFGNITHRKRHMLNVHKEVKPFVKNGTTNALRFT